MRLQFPTRELIRMAWLLSLSKGLLVLAFILLFRMEPDTMKAVAFAVIVFLVNLIMDMVNLALFMIHHKCSRRPRQLSTTQALIVSYFINTSLFLLISRVVVEMFNARFSLIALLFFGIFGIFINSISIMLQHFIILREARSRDAIENARLQEASTEAANQLLRRQIQPHFLFNALNTLKSLYKRDPLAGEDYLVRLSDFLRASLSSGNDTTIPLKNEVKICTDYLEMQKIRFGNALIYSIQIPESEMEKGHLPAFSIQPLVENAIKHNECTFESPLTIRIGFTEGKIIVSNNIRRKPVSEPSTGSGLANLSLRYQLLSGNDLIIEEDAGTFSVSLSLFYHENRHH